MSSNVETTSNVVTQDGNVVTQDGNVVTEDTTVSNVDTTTSNVDTTTSNVDTTTSNVDTTTVSNVDTTTTTIDPQPVITVTRYELYPKDEPTCYVVGFVVSCPSGQKTMYRDTQVPLDQAQGKTEQEIAQIAYTAVQESVDAWVCTEMTKPRILGTQFTPTSS